VSATAVTAADRMGLTLFLAAALHGLVILGVGFAPPERPPQAPKALDVVLVQQKSDEAPDEADYLSNADAAGGGQSDDASRPRAPVSAPEPSARAGLAPAPLEAGAPEPRPQQPQPVVTQREAERKQAADEPTEQPTEHQRRKEQPVDYEARIARLTQEIDNAKQEYAQRPRKTFVTARTRQSPAARYMHDWVESIERTGNANYPDAARREGISGALVLVVAVKADGTLSSVQVRASSGRQLLDEAAENIVRRAAPFKPFDDALRQHTDILYITRTWEFTSGNELETR
jgi:protein TonB